MSTPLCLICLQSNQEWTRSTQSSSNYQSLAWKACYLQQFHTKDCLPWSLFKPQYHHLDFLKNYCPLSLLYLYGFLIGTSKKYNIENQHCLAAKTQQMDSPSNCFLGLLLDQIFFSLKEVSFKYFLMIDYASRVVLKSKDELLRNHSFLKK